MSKFVHLHVHTEYSLLDGATRIKKLAKVCKEYGMPAVAITDHGNLYGATTFYDECKKNGIKAIIGSEFYVAEDLTVKAGKVKLAHLILLAKNEEGYKNISKLSTLSFVDGFYYKPRIDYKILEKYSDGLVCLSACLAGDIPQLIMQRRLDEAEQLVVWFKNVFKDDFYLELQNHGMEEQIFVNEKLRELSKKYGVKTVVTNDVHYIYKEDAHMQDVLMCVQMQKTLDDPDRLKFASDEFYFKTYEQMAEIFPNDLDALETTLEIADKCNYEFTYGKYLVTKYKPENGMAPEQFIRHLIDTNIPLRYGKETPEIRERIEKEMEIISRQGFVEYFLIVWDYINAAKEMKIPVGPGRGSGVGSIVAYLIGITNIDPLKYDLLFERFLHTERVSAPDFDIDFADDRRNEVIEYVKDKYGEEYVCKIVTFGTMAAKASIKDVARVLRMPYSEVNRITKAMPNNIGKPDIIKKCFGLYKAEEGSKDYGVNFGVPELIEMYNNNYEVKQVVDIAIKLEDFPRQTSTHASGIVIGADILNEHIPLSRNGDDITTQFNMVDIERLGYLKMDFLGLRNLNDIQKSIEYIKENHNVDIDLDTIDYNDQEVYKLISTGNTKAIFQIESPGFQRFLRELKPTHLEDIIAGVSLYRPGPMDSIPRYVHNKHNPQDVKYEHPILEPILNVTYGCIVYQEQVMKIVQEMAGYTLGQADMVRRMMSKKKREDMQRERGVFLHGKPSENGKSAIDGAIKRGVSEKVANSIWDQMESFASYAFNKSHAAAYSVVTFQTAYLKTYYKPEFLTAVLNNRITDSEQVKNYVTYCKEEKIEVLPPDINKSQTMFSVKDGKIRFGLAALKGVGISIIDTIVNERLENGDFKDIVDFINRFDNHVLNKRCIDSLILSGAFDCFNVKRSQLMQVYTILLDRASADRKTRASGQYSLFDSVLKTDSVNSVDYPDIEEFDEQTKLKLEKEVIGVYISGHPLSNYQHKFQNYNLTSDMLYSDFAENDANNVMEEEREKEQVYEGLTDGMEVTCGGIMVEIKKLYVKRDGKEMAFGVIEDLYGNIDLMFFPQSYQKFKDKLEVDVTATIKGKLSIRSGENPVVIVNDFTLWENDDVKTKVEKPKTLYLKYDVSNIKLHDEIYKTLCHYKGTSTVVVVDLENKPFKLNIKINPNGFLINELNAFLNDEFIKIK